MWYNTDTVEKAPKFGGRPPKNQKGEKTMAISKAQQKAVNKYVKENYDRINVNMPKGKKESVQAHASRHGISVNAYINAAIDEKMERDNTATETE